MEKTKVRKITCIVLVIAIGITFICGYYLKKNLTHEAYDDGIKQIDQDTIFLKDSGVQVDFSEVIIGKHEEVRKLIVSTQETSVSLELTDRVIEILDFDFLKKTQTVSYTGKGYFVVDLDNLTKADILQDDGNKTITIRIGHAYLQAIEIDPNKILINDVKEGLLAWGDIKLTVKDYNSIEKELKNRMEAAFNTARNAQDADDKALQIVREIYEPIVKAIDAAYEVRVEYR